MPIMVANTINKAQRLTTIKLEFFDMLQNSLPKYFYQNQNNNRNLSAYTPINIIGQPNRRAKEVEQTILKPSGSVLDLVARLERALLCH